MGCPAPCASSSVGTVLRHPPWQRLDPLNLRLHVHRSFLGSFFGKLPASAPRRAPRRAPHGWSLPRQDARDPRPEAGAPTGPVDPSARPAPACLLSEQSTDGASSGRAEARPPGWEGRCERG